MTMRAADLFCGAGGTTAGAEASGVVKVRFALNHWQTAIETHSANFPHTKHVNSRLDQISPSECGPIDLLFASPECTHHSRARGGRPTSDQQRSGAWQVMPWIEHHRPSGIVIENVCEFREWGPVACDGRPLQSGKGKFFDAWLMAIRAAGYRVEWRELNAVDFGAATSRNRLFVIARKGNRNPIFPEPTHCRHPGNELPGFGLPKWRSAAEVIDWSIPCPSIFSRKRPLADKTLQRLEAGLRKFVGPFTAQWDNHSGRGSYVRSIDAPMATITTKAHSGVVIPFGLEVNHSGNGPRLRPLDKSCGTISTKNGLAIAFPWLSHFYGTNNVSPVTDPVDTITTKDRHSIVIALHRGPQDWPEPATDAMRSLQKTMREMGVVDLLFRMFQNKELSLAQGFDPEYRFAGTKADITRQIGNSVSPAVSKAICLSM